jgi:hypothetical protein
MKHTDFFKKTREIKEQEQLELIMAIMAHGGEFNWDEGTERPIIAINSEDYHSGSMDVEVTNAFVENGRLRLVGNENLYGCEVKFGPDDVCTGYLSHIIDYIHETDNVSDVTEGQKFFKITSVSRDDLEVVGFYTKDIQDHEMKTLARKMADDYCEQLFHTSMEIIAEFLNFPRVWDIWFKGLDFMMLEEITGYYQTDFSPENGYQDFVNTCKAWWDSQPDSYRKDIYEEYSLM